SVFSLKFACSPYTPLFRSLVWRDVQSLAPNGDRILGKVAHRGARFVRVAQGLHDAMGVVGKKKVPTTDLEVLHVPQRSYGQFYEKIENSGTAYAANKNPLSLRRGKHLRHDYKRLRSCELEETYRSRNFTDEQIAEADRKSVV